MAQALSPVALTKNRVLTLPLLLYFMSGHRGELGSSHGDFACYNVLTLWVAKHHEQLLLAACRGCQFLYSTKPCNMQRIIQDESFNVYNIRFYTCVDPQRQPARWKTRLLDHSNEKTRRDKLELGK